MAARRAREQRRGSAERRYRFAPTPQGDEVLDGPDESGPVRSPAGEPSPTRRAAAAPARGAPVRPFSAYRAEYAYVLGDLRRIALVVGVLLVMLAILWGVIPR
jgi:hypothetical protein